VPDPASGPTNSPVVLLPSLGRPASDFDDLRARLGAAGFDAVAIELSDLVHQVDTFGGLADVVVSEMADRGVESFHLVGHAFGNRLARQITAQHTDKVSTLTLLACGGSTEMEPHVLEAFLRCFANDISDEDRVRAISTAFFSDSDQASVWTHGWDGALARRQRQLLGMVAVSDWWDAVAPHVLVIQGLDDVIAPPANGRHYAHDHPEVTLVELPAAGHALLPEVPDKIGDCLISFLRTHSSAATRPRPEPGAQAG
jgi:pimeloyl-ACP methyl ester carboxylesterase